MLSAGISVHIYTFRIGASCKHCIWAYRPTVGHSSWSPIPSYGHDSPGASCLTYVNHHLHISSSHRQHFSEISVLLHPA
ncbi:hypothetical protein HanIR_Chr04g0181911 [Helianthus annuus]|nr:hypothetical protein HanIR_Chr04g0181911 [Helianthus annuus]